MKVAGALAASAAIPIVATAQATKSIGDRRRALDHVVVMMFENRSFDDPLGRLYQPGDVRSFEGVIGKDLKNPIPAWAEYGQTASSCPMASRPYDHAKSRSRRGIPAYQY